MENVILHAAEENVIGEGISEELLINDLIECKDKYNDMIDKIKENIKIDIKDLTGEHVKFNINISVNNSLLLYLLEQISDDSHKDMLLRAESVNVIVD